MDDSLTGCDHAALKADPARWHALPYVGVQHTPADDYGPAESLELRNCSCGSTLCLPLPPAALAAPFDAPPSPTDMVPAIRWAFREAGNGAHLVDVIHHVERDGVQVPCVSVVAAERHGRHWEIDTLEGPELDYGSAELLSQDLSAERAGRATAYRIDELDHALERCRIALERRLDHATLADHDWDALRRDGFMAAYDGTLVLDCRTCVECHKSFSRAVPATTEAALSVLRAEGLL